MKKNKKVTLVWPYFPPDPGAAAARGAAYQKYLSPYFDISVITKNNHKFEVYSDKGEIYRLEIDVSINPIKYFRSIKKLIQTIQAIKPDILIASSPNIILAFYVARAANKLTIPFFLDVRDLFFASKGFKFKLLQLIDSYTYKHAQKIFVTTKIQKEMTLERYKVNESKIILVPNGIDLKTFGTSNNIKRPIDLLFQGSLNPERNIEGIIALLDALFAKKPQSVVTFVGLDKSNSFVREFIDTINQKSYSKQIDLVEEVDHKTVLEYISKAKVGLVSLANNKAIRYQLPVKVFEYMAYGAVIAAIIPHKEKTSLQAFISRYNCGVYSNSVAKLANQIAQLISDKNMLLEMQKGNFETIKLYDRKNFIERVRKEIVE